MTGYHLSRGPWFGFNGVYEFECNKNDLVVRRSHKGLLSTWGESESRYPYAAIDLAPSTGGKRLRLRLGTRKEATFTAHTDDVAQAFRTALMTRMRS